MTQLQKAIVILVALFILVMFLSFFIPFKVEIKHSGYIEKEKPNLILLKHNLQ